MEKYGFLVYNVYKRKRAVSSFICDILGIPSTVLQKRDETKEIFRRGDLQYRASGQDVSSGFPAITGR